MNKKILFKQIVGLALLLSAAVPVRAEQVTLNTTSQIEDVQLRSDTPRGNFGGMSYMLVGKVGIATNNTLMRFTDLSAAAGQTVTSAVLRLYQTNWSNQTADVTVNIYQVAAANAGWVEGAGSTGLLIGGTSDWWWKSQTVNTPWAGGQNGCGIAGTDYTTSLVGSVTALAATGGFLNINLDVSVVQNWVDHPEQNYGLVLTAPGATAGQVVWFNSSEAVANVPLLILDIIPKSRLGLYIIN
jgi:hypothetical protein